MDQDHEDPETIDLGAPRLAQYTHTAWKKHPNTVYSGDILRDTLPAYCIPKAIMVETGEVMCEKVFASPRLPPKISIKRHLDEEIGFRSCCWWW